MSSYTSAERVASLSFTSLVRVEYMLVYSELFRRKAALVSFIIYPYLFTFFVLAFGYTLGSPREFEARLGSNPLIYMITASFLLMTMLSAVDDLMWRPLSAYWDGTLPYIIASPVNRILYYLAIPLPRLTSIVVLGFTSIVPVYTYFNGFNGFLESLAVLLLALLGGLVMTTPAMVVAGLVHTIGESWRVLNIVRPIIMILLGVYYPRFLMPLAGALASMALPASHVVEFIQRMLSRTYTPEYTLLVVAVVLAVLYTPLSQRSIYLWERRKVREGVQTA